MKTSEIIQYRRKFLGMTLEQVADAMILKKKVLTFSFNLFPNRFLYESHS